MTEGVREAFELERWYQENLGITCKVQVDGYTNFVFVNRFGNVQHQGTLNKALRRIIRDCNDEILENADGKEVTLLPPFTCHGLRHTFATRMCEANVNMKIVQKILGHADIGTTMNIYTDATKDFEKKGMEKFDEYINGVSTNYESLVVPVSRG